MRKVDEKIDSAVILCFADCILIACISTHLIIPREKKSKHDVVLGSFCCLENLKSVHFSHMSFTLSIF